MYIHVLLLDSLVFTLGSGCSKRCYPTPLPRGIRLKWCDLLLWFMEFEDCRFNPWRDSDGCYDGSVTMGTCFRFCGVSQAQLFFALSVPVTWRGNSRALLFSDGVDTHVIPRPVRYSLSCHCLLITWELQTDWSNCFAFVICLARPSCSFTHSSVYFVHIPLRLVFLTFL